MKTGFRSSPLTYKEAKAIMKPDAVKEVPGGVKEVKRHLMRSANLYVLCIRAVNLTIAAHMPAIAQTSEMFQSAVASLFIDATRWRLHEKLPDKPMAFE
jgi:hypothetical protein